MVFLMTYIDSVMESYPILYFIAIDCTFSNVFSSPLGFWSGVRENRRLRRVFRFLSDLQTVQRKDSGWRRRPVSGGRVQGRTYFAAFALMKGVRLFSGGSCSTSSWSQDTQLLYTSFKKSTSYPVGHSLNIIHQFRFKVHSTSLFK